MTPNSHRPEFISEMKARLLNEKETLLKELGREAHKADGDYQADYPDYGRHDDENASEMADYVTLYATTEAAEKQLENVEMALRRIEDGTYGLAADGQFIPEDRLRANPSATGTVKQ